MLRPRNGGGALPTEIGFLRPHPRWCIMRWIVSAAFLSTALLPLVCDAQEAPSPKRGERLFVSGGGWPTYSSALLPRLFLCPEEWFLTPQRAVGLPGHLC